MSSLQVVVGSRPSAVLRVLSHTSLLLVVVAGLAGCWKGPLVIRPGPLAARVRVVEASVRGPLAAAVAPDGSLLFAFGDPTDEGGYPLLVGKYTGEAWQQEAAVLGAYMRPRFSVGTDSVFLVGLQMMVADGNGLFAHRRGEDGRWVPWEAPPVPGQAREWSLRVGVEGESHWAVVAFDSRTRPLIYLRGEEGGWSQSLVSSLFNRRPALELVDGGPVLFYWEQQSGEWRLARQPGGEGSWSVTPLPLPRVAYDPTGIEPWRQIPDSLTATTPIGGVAFATLWGREAHVLIWDGAGFTALPLLDTRRLPAGRRSESTLLDLDVDDRGRVHLLVKRSGPHGDIVMEGEVRTATLFHATLPVPAGPWHVQQVADDASGWRAHLLLTDLAGAVVAYIAADGVLYLQPLGVVQPG